MTDHQHTQWYVIQNPHKTNTHVLAGPLTKKDAAHKAATHTTHASIIHTQGLKHATHNTQHHLTWADDTTKPDDLEVARA